MIRKKKSYARPMKPFEGPRIAEENLLVKEYGLKNKKEVWKSLAKINYYKKRAMALARSPSEEQEAFFNKLRHLGLKVNSVSDILGLKIEDLLRRRLPSIVNKKRLAKTVKQARQLVVHKKITVKCNVIDSPSYIVSVDEENRIDLKKKVKQSVETPKVDINDEIAGDIAQ